MCQHQQLQQPVMLHGMAPAAPAPACSRHARLGKGSGRLRGGGHMGQLLLASFTLTALALLLPSRLVAAKDLEPGAVFFHQGDKALSWDHDALMTARKLRTADIKQPDDFLTSRSVGDYFGFRPVEALHMPVPVNLVFVGFAADGNMHVNISTEQLQEWFGHLDHVLPHSRVELAEISCAEDGHCAGLVHGTYEPRPVPSYVHLNFSCNLVVTQRVAVARTFERAIHAFSRPVDPEIEMGAQQVDIARMEEFVNNFLQHLNLHDRGYTMIVMNPTWSASEPVYGYRLGMSQAEMDLLLLSTDKVKQAMHSAQHFPVMPAPPHGGWWSKPSRQDVTKFGKQDLTWNCDAWLTGMDKYLTQVEDYRKKMLKAVGPIKGAAAIVQAVSLINFGREPISNVLKEELLYPDPYQSVYSKFRTMHPAEDCLVGNWVSAQRWLMLDLTAGNFDWGPALGGEGVVHRHSIPSVVDHFSHLATVKQKVVDARKTEEDKQLDQQIESKVQQTKSERANRAFQAYAYEIQLKKGQRGAPGAPQQAETQEEVDEQARQWKIKYQEAILKAELDVYTEYSAKYCDGVAQPMPVCQKMKEASLSARNLLAKLAGSQAGSVDVWRDVSWNVFKSEMNMEELDIEVQDAAQRARDLFMAELNNVLSRALRHVVAPPTATWTRAGGYLHDTATPWPTHVTFQIYVIRESVHANTEVIPDTRPFDVDGFKHQVSRLALPTQHFTFTQHTLSLQDDPVLATAVASAQRTSAQEIPTDTSTTQEAERVYLDTRVLAHVLRQRFGNVWRRDHMAQPPASVLAAARQARVAAYNAPNAAKPPTGARPPPSGSASHAHHDVPVFVFELHREYAVLLDEHYNAKALEDMVVIVQNAARDDEHPTGMMCGGALLARPLSALREALSATLLHLSGVLPPHLGYNPGRRRVMHDWLWSVGSHPHSFTSVGVAYSELQRDAAARSYLLDAVDSSVDAVNAGIRALRRVNPTQQVLLHLKASKGELEELLDLWPALLEHWRSVMEAAWNLDWATASRELPTIEDSSLKFLQLAQKLATVPLGGHCQGIVKQTTEALVFPTLVTSVAVAGAALVWLLWPAVFQRAGRDRERYRVKY